MQCVQFMSFGYFEKEMIEVNCTCTNRRAGPQLNQSAQTWPSTEISSWGGTACFSLIESWAGGKTSSSKEPFQTT